MDDHRDAALTAAPARDWPVLIRRARADDRDAVLAFASRTWDGWDYVPRAWPHWLAADDGVLLVATAGRDRSGAAARDADGHHIADDRPIAVARVSMLSAQEAWLEGIRVDPRVRGLGVATDLQVAELRWAVASGARVVRYATGERNEASHRLGARHGFELLVALRLWSWHEHPPSDEDNEDDESEERSGFDDELRAEATRRRQALLADLEADGLACLADDGDDWWDRLVADPTFAAGQRMSEHRGWTMQQLTRDLFEMHLERGEVLVTGDASRSGSAPGRGEWALAVIHREALPSEDVDIHLSVLAGEGRAALHLVDEIRRTADAPIRFWLPDPDPPMLNGGLRSAFESAGFHARPWALHILARPLDTDHPLPEPDDPDALVLADEPVAIRPHDD